MSKSWHALAITAAGLALATLAFWPQHTLLEGYDWTRMHVFYKNYFRDSVLSGRLPLWNPYSGLGRPFLADAETATLYPPNLVYLTGIGSGLFATLAGHFALAIHGMLKCTRRLGCLTLPAWTAALAFSLGAPLMGRLQSGQLQVFCTLCWLPFVLDLGCALQDQPSIRNSIKLAAAFALMFLAGSPPYFWVTAWTVMIFLLFRRPTCRSSALLVLAGSLALGLAAAQIIPFIELLSQGNRHLRDLSFATHVSEAPRYWLSLVYAKNGDSFFTWERNLYSGILMAVLAIASAPLWLRPAARPILVTGSLLTLLALGAATPLLPWLATHVPGWGALRIPARYAIGATFAVILLAAITLERAGGWLNAKGQFGQRCARCILFGALLFNSADLVLSFVNRAEFYSRPNDDTKEFELATVLRSQGLLARTSPPPRVVAPKNLVCENSGLTQGYSTLTSFSNPALARTWDFLHVSAGVQSPPLEPIFPAAAVYSIDPLQFHGIDLAAYWSPPPAGIVLTSNDARRAYVVNQVTVVQNWHDANLKIAHGHPLEQIALVEKDIPFPHSSSSFSTAKFDSFSPERLLLRCESSYPGLLVLAEPWYPGWRAKVDGHESDVIPVNGWMRAVSIIPGTHVVEISFSPPSVKIGIAISAFTCLLMGLLWFKSAPPVRAAA